MTAHLYIDIIVLNGQSALEVNRIASALKDAAVPDHVLLDVARAVAHAAAQRKENP